jgi:hypothetical protein
MTDYFLGTFESSISLKMTSVDSIIACVNHHDSSVGCHT